MDSPYAHKRPSANVSFPTTHRTNARQQKTPALGPGFCTRIEGLAQLVLRRLMKPIPARPRPASASVAGSGTDAVDQRRNPVVRQRRRQSDASFFELFVDFLVDVHGWRRT